MSKKESKEKPKTLWIEYINKIKYRVCVTNDINADEMTVRMEDLEKRKAAYGICGECGEPGTGWYWCQSCNAKRFEEDFKNWTSRNKNIDEFIQQSQLNATFHGTALEWIPFEKFKDVKYIAKGGFGKIYSAEWPEGYIDYWDIESEKWINSPNKLVALKSLDNNLSSNIDFLNEIKSHLQIYLVNVISCYGITQNTNTNEYMMVLEYRKGGNLREFLSIQDSDINKIVHLCKIANGLLGIHNAGKVHKDLHSGNILFHIYPSISDLGMCQQASEKQKGIYGVLPYVAPEVLRGHQYTQAADIYSFGIIMNEYLSERTPYDDVSHDHILAVKICEGLRPEISRDTPKLLADLIMKCLDAEAGNRPTAKELNQILTKWRDEKRFDDSKVCKHRGNKSNKSKNLQTHPQAIYTSRLLNFNNLPKPVNSSDLSSFQFNPISGDLQLNLNEADLKSDSDDSQNNAK